MPHATVSDIEMYYETYGDGEPLLITSGWARAERAHVHHRDLFAEHYLCIRHDHRGMGRSGAPDYPYTTQMMGDDLAGLLDHLALDKVRVLGGGGMGGLIAAQLAINHPDRVRSLFIGAGCAKADNFLRTVKARMEGPLRPRPRALGSGGNVVGVDARDVQPQARSV